MTTPLILIIAGLGLGTVAGVLLYIACGRALCVLKECIVCGEAMEFGSYEEFKAQGLRARLDYCEDCRNNLDSENKEIDDQLAALFQADLSEYLDMFHTDKP